jgi:hypothetical protein
MPKEPYYRPGEGTEKPLVVPTQFCPQKPAGPDPVSPMPLPEGSEITRHAQLYALDPVSGLFKPVTWVDGKLAVDAVIDASQITIGAIKIEDATDGSVAKVVTVGTLIDGLKALVVQNREMGNPKYFPYENTVPAGTDQMIDFGVVMKDVYMRTANPISVKFNSATEPAVALKKGQFDFGSIWASKVFVTATAPTDMQIFANG